MGREDREGERESGSWIRRERRGLLTSKGAVLELPVAEPTSSGTQESGTQETGGRPRPNAYCNGKVQQPREQEKPSPCPEIHAHSGGVGRRSLVSIGPQLEEDAREECTLLINNLIQARPIFIPTHPPRMERWPSIRMRHRLRHLCQILKALPRISDLGCVRGRFLRRCRKLA